MSGKQNRRTFSGQEKVAIVKRHLIDGVPVSDLCEEQRIQPTLFYQWQKQVFENGAGCHNLACVGMFPHPNPPASCATTQRQSSSQPAMAQSVVS